MANKFRTDAKEIMALGLIFLLVGIAISSTGVSALALILLAWGAYSWQRQNA